MQVYHETMFDGPWYQCDGPNASEVRDDLKKKYKKGWHAKNNYFKHIYMNNLFDSNKIIDEEVNRGITDAMMFGSWRGYATFGINEAIITNLNKYINRRLAINILSKYLKFHLNHYLYKPGGIRTKELKKDFEKLKKK